MTGSNTVLELWFSNRDASESPAGRSQSTEGPPPGILIEVLWEAAWGSAFLTRFQGRLILLVQRPAP